LKRNQPDEDGFVLVQGGKTNKDGQGASVAAFKADQAKNPKKRGLVDFYRFQVREAKRTGTRKIT
jgi:hypothetical protein